MRPNVSGAAIFRHRGDHEPPHVHVYYQGHRAKVDIDTTAVLAGHLPPRVPSDARLWIFLSNGGR
ncbi:MAG: DUF4160 domain-containing protein [Firmicutes bacterium]|nr:DUF4160 domain-containing protein [Bacillota bacterium]